MSRVRVLAGALFHKIEKTSLKILAYETEFCGRKKSKCEQDLYVRYAKDCAPILSLLIRPVFRPLTTIINSRKSRNTKQNNLLV